jgi:hypothetical protein
MTTNAAPTAKSEALDLISQLPDEVSTETIVAELQFKLLVLRRRDSARQGNVVTHEDAKKRLSRWLDSSGK